MLILKEQIGCSLFLVDLSARNKCNALLEIEKGGKQTNIDRAWVTYLVEDQTASSDGEKQRLRHCAAVGFTLTTLGNALGHRSQEVLWR